MLDRGDEAILSAPKVDFFRDVERIPLPRTKFQARPAEDHAAEAADADAADITAALKERKVPLEKREQILAAFALERNKLTILRGKLQQWNPDGRDEWEDGKLQHIEPDPRPSLADFNVQSLGDAPGEFVQYLQGSVAWFNGETENARVFWEALLRRPAEERHYRSTWAAYMLGKSWADEDPEKAAGYFQQARVLKTAKFADRLGLAAASLGEEARVRLRQNDFNTAMDLYLQQLAAGDPSAASSLRFTCRRAITNTPETLERLAAGPSARRVLTSYLISDASRYEDDPNDAKRLAWLQAVESANVADMECAEELALAAYQTGQWDIAKRWIARAPATPVSRWLESKLLLRAGKIDEAAAVLHEVVKLFPAAEPAVASDKPAGLEDTLSMDGFTYLTNFVSMRAQTLAETGALHLARREYTEALDALLASGFWLDAAYIAERVLTIGELKNYVDQNCPPLAANAETNAAGSSPGPNLNDDLRYLLGRRMARENDWNAARAYYPREQLTNFDALVSALATSEAAETAANEKAGALWDAAKIIRIDGMELLGCEVEPDWAVNPDFSFYLTIDHRTNSQIMQATDDELERAQSGIDPSRRFHYRYQAASLAMEAAKLMADNTDQKAIVLCTAGTWLKARDPQAADVFYKALVRHCRKTAIGALADRMRWFPELDENGTPVPWEPPPPIETNAPPEAATVSESGLWYSLNRGNTLQDVADAAEQGHQLAVTLAQIEEANTNVNFNRLKAGLRIFVPAQGPVERTGQ